MREFFYKSNSKFIFYGINLLLLAVIGYWMVLYATVWGAGWVADSYQYIGTARSFAHTGRLAYPSSGGVLIPLTHYPPAFPIFLAAFESIGLDAYSAVRHFHAFLFSLNIVLIGMSAYRGSHSLSAGFFAALLALFSAPLLERHAWALSEPLFLSMVLSGFLLVDTFYRTNKRFFLISALICLAIACLTRYVGVAVVVTLLLILILFRQQDWKQTLFNIALTILVPLLPLLLWTWRSIQVESLFFDRTPTFTPLGIKNWLSMIQTLAGWVFPGRVVYGREKWFVYLGIAVMMGLLIWWFFEAYRRKITPIQLIQPVRLIPIYILLSLLYVPFVIGGKLFFDPMIGFTERMLIPTQLSVLIILPIFLNFLWKKKNWVGKAIVIPIAILFLVYYVNEGSQRLERLHKQGLGVANRRWHESQVIKTLQNVEGGDIYSNSLSTMYLWRQSTGWDFTDLTKKDSSATGEQIYLVVFHYLQLDARLQKFIDQLPVLAEDRIATIYIYPILECEDDKKQTPLIP